MKLLEAATPHMGVQIRAYENFPARECGVEMVMSEFCDNTPEEIAMIGTPTSTPGEYKTASFPLQGFLRRGTLCARPEDQAWFGKAFQKKLNFALTWALTVEHQAGSEAWTNGAGVQTVALAGTSDTQLRDVVAAARLQWEQTVFSDGDPILHVPAKYAAALKATGVLESSDKSIHGDRVVISSGYDIHPNIFYTGDIEVMIGPMEQDLVHRAQINHQTTVIDIGVMFKVPPCSIVRAGAYA